MIVISLFIVIQNNLQVVEVPAIGHSNYICMQLKWQCVLRRLTTNQEECFLYYSYSSSCYQVVGYYTMKIKVHQTCELCQAHTSIHVLSHKYTVICMHKLQYCIVIYFITIATNVCIACCDTIKLWCISIQWARTN